MVTLLFPAALSCAIKAASASMVKSNVPVKLPIENAGAGVLAILELEKPEKDLPVTLLGERASVYVLNPGPLTTLADLKLLAKVERPAPPERTEARGRASR
jgi:hypothetical protein